MENNKLEKPFIQGILAMQAWKSHCIDKKQFYDYNNIEY